MGLDVLTVRLRYLFEHRDRHGNWRLYVRRGARMVRIRETPGTPAFLDAYKAALERLDKPATPRGPATRQNAPAPADSLLWLCQRYCTSADFKMLDPRTAMVRRRILDGLCLGNDGADGLKPFARLEPQHVAARRDSRADRPEAANAIVKALRQVFAWARQPHVKLATTNPAREVPYLKSGSDGFHTWTVGEVRQYEARHPLGTMARLAMAILLFTGVRRSDGVRLGRQMVRQGWLNFTEHKGRARHAKHREIPILPELQTAIDAGPAGNLTFIVTQFGAAFTSNGFGNRFRKWCDEAGLSHCSAHGLRKAGATIAANNGATGHQLMAIYGWESPKQAELYTRKADRRRLVGEAMHLVAPGQSRNENESPAEVVANGDSILPAKSLRNKGAG